MLCNARHVAEAVLSSAASAAVNQALQSMTKYDSYSIIVVSSAAAVKQIPFDRDVQRGLFVDGIVKLSCSTHEQ
jgi:hypothetical protein